MVSMEDSNQNLSQSKFREELVSFSEHLKELRRRLFAVAVVVAIGSALAYWQERHVVSALLKPADGHQLIYTSPIGGVDFLFRVCLYVGVALSIPVIIYNFLRFIGPAFEKRSTKATYVGTAISALLAVLGLLFGYFIGLPNAMNFLLHQTVTNQVMPLLTAQAYMSFVVKYMIGSALIFQLPLVIIFINRIKPLKIRRLLHHERWVILVSFILSMLMNPTPRISSQLIIAGPLIMSYQLSILIVYLVNRKRSKKQPQAASSYQPTVVRAVRPPTRPMKPGIKVVGGRQLISDFR